MSVGTSILLFAAGAALLLGFVADVLARRFGLPDVLWLLLLGILIGPVAGIISFSEVVTFAPYLGVATLSLILFDAGMDMRRHTINERSLHAVLLAIASVVVTMTVVFPLAYYFVTDKNAMLSLVFAAAMSATSSGVVVTVASRLSITLQARSLVHLTTAVEDAAAILIVTSLLLFLLPAGSSPMGFGQPIFFAALNLPLGILGGILAGLLWVEISAKLQSTPYFPMATIGFLFFVVGVVDYFDGAGIIAALVMGIVVGNASSIRKWLGWKGYFVMSQRVRQFGGEIAFLTRAFFLFAMGLLVIISQQYLFFFLVGAIAGVAILLVRTVCVWLFIDSAELPHRFLLPISAMSARGLTSAVLILLPVSAGLVPNSHAFIEAAMAGIIVTTVSMSIGVWGYEREFHTVGAKKRSPIAIGPLAVKRLIEGTIANEASPTPADSPAGSDSPLPNKSAKTVTPRKGASRKRITK